IHYIVIRDEDYQTAIRKLLDSKFVSTVPDRSPPFEVIEHLPDPQDVLKEINEGYKGLDQSSTTFNYPNSSPEKKEQVVLIPNSFAHIPLGPAYSTNQYDKYNNILYPLERALIESFVKAALDDEKENNITSWGESLRSWISMMVGYLDITNDVLDTCEDHPAVEWFSAQFGRGHEATSGPLDRRITKRLGSGKEMPVDMRGHPLF
ncbi:MAG: hypothetical protein LQ347_004615, partial [Umbilicaria vellea]